MDSCSFRWPTWPEGNTEKNYLVHIAASLRHRELYGKKAYHLPSGAAVGSVHSWVRVDILESHSDLVQLSETIYHRESNPQPTKTSMDPWNLRGIHISVYFAAKRLQFKRKSDSLIDLLIWDDFSGKAKGTPREGMRVPQPVSQVQKKKASRGTLLFTIPQRFWPTEATSYS